jgi:hypothetical protein
MRYPERAQEIYASVDISSNARCLGIMKQSCAESITLV